MLEMLSRSQTEGNTFEIIWLLTQAVSPYFDLRNVYVYKHEYLDDVMQLYDYKIHIDRLVLK